MTYDTISRAIDVVEVTRLVLIDVFTMTLAACLIIPSAALILYFWGSSLRKLYVRELNNTVQAVVNSLNKKLGKIDEKVDVAVAKAEGLSTRVDELEHKQEEEWVTINTLTESVGVVLKAQAVTIGAVGRLNKKVSNFYQQYGDVEGQVKKLHESYREPLPETEKAAIETERSAIRIPRLTPTEAKILTVLASSGPKTGPEIREIIGKTREHAARLMKKLYVEGYIERDTTNLPYTYKLKEKIRQTIDFPSETSM